MGVSVSALVVEDDPDLRRLYRLWLGDEYDVQTVADGESAVDVAGGNADVVVLDRDLPGIDGDTVAHSLNANGFQGSIAMVTGEAPDPSVARLPISEYVRKPIDAAQLQATVDQLSARQAVAPSVRVLFGLLTRRARLDAALDAGHLADSDSFEELHYRIDEQWETVRREFSVSQVRSMAEDCLPPVVDQIART